MTLLSNDVAQQLASALRENSHLLSQQIALTRLAQPQVWDWAMLSAHYPAWSEKQLQAALVEHCGYVPMTGRKVSIKLAQVEHLDAILSGRLSA